jgi:hypothetical protein
MGARILIARCCCPCVFHIGSLPAAPPPLQRLRRLVLLPLCILHMLLLAAPIPRHRFVLPVLLPLLLAHWLLLAGPAVPLRLDRSPSTRLRMHTPCAPVARPASHSPWIASSSTLCPCRLYRALSVILCQTPIGALLCKLSMMSSSQWRS